MMGESSYGDSNNENRSDDASGKDDDEDENQYGYSPGRDPLEEEGASGIKAVAIAANSHSSLFSPLIPFSLEMTIK